MGNGVTGTALRVGRLVGGSFDPLEGHGGPVARARSVADLGLTCPVPAGIPPEANVTSVRNAPPLYGLGLIESIPDAAIRAEAERQRADGRVHGAPHLVTDVDGQERIGRLGWKSQLSRLDEFVADAFRSELGITSPMAPTDFVIAPLGSQCGGSGRDVDDDGSTIRSVTAFIRALEDPSGQAEHTQPVGAALFRQIGCADCHTPTYQAPNGEVPLYSDLLLHDVGPALDDGVVQGQAAGRQWRTTPLWGLRMRRRLLHDARAETIAAAIAAHGGEATTHVQRFRSLSPAERESLLAFLNEL
jgi:CxxC motif-containing protein (DUF1111 family)